MKISYFTHSLLSCWNHGNAHFLRGVLSELIRRGHDVSTYEPEGAWSLDNLLADAGEAGLDAFRQHYPDLHSHSFGPGFDPAEACAEADLVIVHEWNEPALVAALGRARRNGARFTLLFHDTHHRAVSDPDAIRAFDLDGYDGVLAFGETLAAVYRRWGWGDRVFVWHEAADTRVFRPPAVEGERLAAASGTASCGSATGATASARPSSSTSCSARRGGSPCRSTSTACATPTRRGTRCAATRRITAAGCPTLPRPPSSPATAPPCTCRGASTSSCCPASRPSGSSRPWPAASRSCPPPGTTARGCSPPGRDFLMARSGAEMEKMLLALRDDADLRSALVAHGLATIAARHTCAHRVDELTAVLATLQASPAPTVPA